MKMLNVVWITGLLIVGAAVSSTAFAQDYEHSTPGLGGYDPVAYFTDGKPMKGSGYHVAMFEGVTYAFVNEANKERFEANPGQYAPAYGGYCAYGVAVGKKFVADPEVWKIVGGTLYVNLDRDIQRKWEKDIPGHIAEADDNWVEIKDKAPADL